MRNARKATPPDQRNTSRKFSELFEYSHPETSAPTPIPLSRNIYIVAMALPRYWSRERSTTQAVVVGLYMPTAAPNRIPDRSSTALVSAKATEIMASIIQIAATRKTTTLPYRSEVFPAISLIPSEEIVNTAKNSPLV